MSKEPVAWVTPQDLIDMRANALIGTKDWSLTVGLKPEKGDVPLYTAPLKQKWVGLTDEEITEIRLKMVDAVATNYETYCAIESKLREKNT